MSQPNRLKANNQAIADICWYRLPANRQVHIIKAVRASGGETWMLFQSTLPRRERQ